MLVYRSVPKMFFEKPCEFCWEFRILVFLKKSSYSFGAWRDTSFSHFSLKNGWKQTAKFWPLPLNALVFLLCISNCLVLVALKHVQDTHPSHWNGSSGKSSWKRSVTDEEKTREVQGTLLLIADMFILDYKDYKYYSKIFMAGFQDLSEVNKSNSYCDMARSTL